MDRRRAVGNLAMLLGLTTIVVSLTLRHVATFDTAMLLLIGTASGLFGIALSFDTWLPRSMPGPGTRRHQHVR